MLKKIVLVVVLLVMLVGATLFVTGQQYLAAYVEQKVIQASMAHGLGLRVESSSLAFPAYTLKGVDISVVRPFFFWQGQVDEFEVSVDLAKLLGLSLHVPISGKLYGGILSGSWDSRLAASSGKARLSLTDIQLKELQPLGAFGVLDGSFSLQVDDAQFNLGAWSKARGALSIVGLSKPNQTSVTLGLPIPVVIPRLDRFNLTGLVEWDSPELRLRSFESTSNLGKLSMQASVSPINRPQVRTVQLEARIYLSQEGHTYFEPYLGAFLPPALVHSTLSYLVRVSGKIDAPKIEVTPL